MMVAGIGCRTGVSAAEVEAALAAALRMAGQGAGPLDAVAVPAFKRDEAGVSDAATQRGVALLIVSQQDCEAASSRTLTRSERVQALTGLPSVSEAAALAACGPEARLLGPRIAVGAVTCALAVREAVP